MTVRNLSYWKKLPRYNTALGMTETLVVTPPFSFQGVTARVFPLRARMNSLCNFCDRYLNVAPQVCTFRPYLPYVFLVVLDYGRMAIEELNLGWISQNEVFFGVPLTMWHNDRLGRPVFKKWVMNTPFIVVDDARSLSGGRESYGWPKVLGTLQSSPERWLIDPRNPTRFLTLDIRGADSEDSSVRLLDIEQQSSQNAALAPPDLEMIDPFARLSRWTRTFWTMGADLAELFLGASLSGFDPRRRGDDPCGERTAVLFESLRRLPDFLGEPGLDVVTLKQFRGTQDPTQICYQALVESRLRVARYNRGGFLGSYNILQGDITGGFRIRLHDNPTFPIVESFGLEVAQERTFRTSTVRRQTISFLEPFFPFWMSVDLSYGKGRTICWRTDRAPWHVRGTRVGRTPRKRVHYNTIAGGAGQVWHGPFYIPQARFDVYPLKADDDRIDSLLEGYLGALNTQYFSVERMKETPAYVYMFASANQMLSKARSGEHIQSSQISFYIPVSLISKQEKEFRLICLATPFAFVDNPVLATTMREVQGIPAMDASIESASQFPGRKGPLLKLQADVFAALGAGLPSRRSTLIEVRPASSSKQSGERSGSQLDKYKKILGDIEGRLSLKQFRDTERPDRACHQSLVYEQWRVSLPSDDSVTLSDSVEVLVHQYPSLPLVEILGLEIEKPLPPRPGGAIAHVLKAGQPFSVEASVEIGLGLELAEHIDFVDLSQWHSSGIAFMELTSPARKDLESRLFAFEGKIPGR